MSNKEIIKNGHSLLYRIVIGKDRNAYLKRFVAGAALMTVGYIAAFNNPNAGLETLTNVIASIWVAIQAIAYNT
jgi:hypothetical protein